VPSTHPAPASRPRPPRVRASRAPAKVGTGGVNVKEFGGGRGRVSKVESKLPGSEYEELGGCGGGGGAVGGISKVESELPGSVLRRGATACHGSSCMHSRMRSLLVAV